MELNTESPNHPQSQRPARNDNIQNSQSFDNEDPNLNYRSVTEVNIQSTHSDNIKHNKSHFTSASVRPKYQNPIACFESSNSLQNSVKNIYFMKDTRFKEASKQSTDSLYSPKWWKSSPSAGIGYGKKKLLYINNGVPSSNAYHIKSCFESDWTNRKGVTIKGIYQISNKMDNPGPGAYKSERFKSSKIPVTIQERHSYFHEDMMKGRAIVSPQQYKINRCWIESNRYNGIGIGFGQKGGFVSSTTPGVGTYNLPSAFDLTKRVKYAIN